MQIFILATLFILYGESAFADDDPSCAPTLPLVVNGRSLYYIDFTHRGTAVEASAFCRKHNMDLLSIETAEEQDFIRNTLLSYMQSEELTGFWTSGRKNSNGKWVWASTGLQIHYTNWWKDQPDNQNGNQDCLQLVYHGSDPEDITWDDLNCDDLDRYFVCEYNFEREPHAQL